MGAAGSFAADTANGFAAGCCVNYAGGCAAVSVAVDGHSGGPAQHGGYAPGGDCEGQLARVRLFAGRWRAAGQGPVAGDYTRGGERGDAQGGGLGACRVAAVLHGGGPRTQHGWADMDLERAVRGVYGGGGRAERGEIPRRDGAGGQELQLGTADDADAERRRPEHRADVPGAISEGQEAGADCDDPGGAGRNSGRTAPGDGNTAEDYMVVVRCAVHGTAGVVADVCGDRRQEVHCVSG